MKATNFVLPLLAAGLIGVSYAGQTPPQDKTSKTAKMETTAATEKVKDATAQAAPAKAKTMSHRAHHAKHGAQKSSTEKQPVK